MTRDELIQAMARAWARADGCGISWCGETVCCNDPRAKEAEDGYGKPMWREDCGCHRATVSAFEALEAARPDIAAVLRGDAVAVPRDATSAMLDAAEAVVEIGPMEILHIDDRTLVRDGRQDGGGTWKMGMVEGPDTLFISQGRRTGPARMWAAMIEVGQKEMG